MAYLNITPIIACVKRLPWYSIAKIIVPSVASAGVAIGVTAKVKDDESEKKAREYAMAYQKQNVIIDSLEQDIAELLGDKEYNMYNGDALL